MDSSAVRKLASLTCALVLLAPWMPGSASADEPAFELETLLLQRDPIPGTDDKFVVLEYARGWEDALVISAGIDFVTRLAGAGFAGPQPTFEDGIWVMSRDREIEHLAPFPGQSFPPYRSYTVYGFPNLFDAQGRASLTTGFGGEDLFLVEPGQLPELELAWGDLIEGGTREIRSIYARAHLGRERVLEVLPLPTVSDPGPQLPRRYLGDPQGSGHAFLDPTLPLAAGTDVLPSATTFVQRDATGAFVVAREQHRTPEGRLEIGRTAIAHIDDSLSPRLLLQEDDPIPGASGGSASTFSGAPRSVAAGRSDEIIFHWQGLWRIDAERKLRNILQHGDPAPGTALTFHVGASQRFVANSRGEVAFIGWFSTPLSPAGIWVADADGDIELRVLGGETQGDIHVPGPFFSGFPHLMDDGSLFLSQKRWPDGELLFVAPDGTLTRVAGVGHEVEVREGDVRTVKTLAISGTFDGGLVLFMHFEGGSRGIFRAAGVKCEPEWSRARHGHVSGGPKPKHRTHRHWVRIDECGGREAAGEHRHPWQDAWRRWVN